MNPTLRVVVCGAGVLGSLLALGASGATVEEVIAKHVEARGGASRWRAIETLEISGTMTSWSRTSPFVLQRKRDALYHLDSTQNGKKVEVGYDGHNAWWDNHWVHEGAQKVRGADLPVVLRETDFVTPFFDYRDLGYEVQLLGNRQFEGRQAIAIELKRKDGLAETWYLDPTSYLEIARESPGADFGRPVPLRTYYDDFRTVDGVKMPFHVESQWYTRERVLHVERVETNVTVDDAIFRMPPPIGMGPLLPLVGTFSVAVSRRDDPQAPWSESERTSVIEAHLGGGLMQQSFTTEQGNPVIRTLTYDRFRKRYRVTEVSEFEALLDVLEGTFDEQQRLVLSNVSSGTSSEQFGFTIHGRMTFFDITPDGFRTEEEYSIDGGTEWVLAQKATYTRAPQ